MKIMITDDEPLARSRLRSLLEEIGGYTIIGEAATGKELLQNYLDLLPDIVLLDIHMPGMSGLEVATHLAALEQSPAVIFTTAYSEHALQAFDAQAVDYLLKPVRKQRLQQALLKAQTLSGTQLQAVQEAKGDKKRRTHLCIHLRNKIQLVALCDVIYFRADQKYVSAQHTSGQALLEESLKSLEQEFAGEFTRIHRNSLISNNFITGIEKTASGCFCVILRESDDRLEISRRHLAGIKALLNNMTHR